MKKSGSNSRSNRRRTATATSFGSNSNSVGKLKQVLSHVNASVQERTVAPSAAEMRRAVENGECPFCGKKYRNIALHTNMTHGVDKNQLKQMLGIPKTKPACSPELSQQMAERGRRDFAENPERKKTLKPAGGKRRLSEAGRLVSLASLENARKVQSAKAAAEGMTRMEWLAEHNRGRRVKTSERDLQIVALFEDGLGSADIAQRLGIKGATIRRALKNHGIYIDLRTRAVSLPERISAARAITDAKIQAQADARLALWNQLGRDRSAVIQCAEEWGLSAKSTREWLKQNGQEVPDGRKR